MYRATVLSNIRTDPRFLSLLPFMFPIPPWGSDVLCADNPVDVLVAYIQRLINVYPPYLSTGKSTPFVLYSPAYCLPETWFHLRLDPEGILPFVPYIMGPYDPSDLSRFLSTDLPQVSNLRFFHIHTYHTPRLAMGWADPRIRGFSVCYSPPGIDSRKHLPTADPPPSLVVGLAPDLPVPAIWCSPLQGRAWERWAADTLQACN